MGIVNPLQRCSRRDRGVTPSMPGLRGRRSSSPGRGVREGPGSESHRQQRGQPVTVGRSCRAGSPVSPAQRVQLDAKLSGIGNRHVGGIAETLPRRSPLRIEARQAAVDRVEHHRRQRYPSRDSRESPMALIVDRDLQATLQGHAHTVAVLVFGLTRSSYVAASRAFAWRSSACRRSAARSSRHRARARRPRLHRHLAPEQSPRPRAR